MKKLIIGIVYIAIFILSVCTLFGGKSTGSTAKANSSTSSARVSTTVSAYALSNASSLVGQALYPTNTASVYTPATSTPKATATPKPTAAPTLKAAQTKKAEQSKASANYTITVSYRTDGYNHVGSEWSNRFTINNERISGSKTLTLTEGDSLTFKAVFTESDKVPDTGSNSKVLNITSQVLENGFTVSFDVKVKENRGKYSGCVCTWHVTFTGRRNSWVSSPAQTSSTTKSASATSKGSLAASVTAQTVCIRDYYGNPLYYLGTGEKLTVTGYKKSIDSFSVVYNGKSGYVKGIGLNYSYDQLFASFGY